MCKKKTKEQFIDESRQIHGDKFDYSKVEYINNKTKVCIVCNTCGHEFWQTPDSHLRGHGCPYCAGTAVFTTEEFIEKAKAVHGDEFDYSKVKCVNSTTEVCIIHKSCGTEFWQSPHNHLKCKTENCCPTCNTKNITTESFIQRANKIHNNKYDYSKVQYINYEAKVCIICPEHGEFWQTPHDHLSGHGCPNCSGSKKATTEEFVEKAKKVHGDKYDYSKVNYINRITPIIIICPVHGDFLQRPNDHLSGCGCQKCANKLVLRNGQWIAIDTKEFIRRAKEVHGDKYDYSKVEYKSIKTKVCIICPIHGEFWQTPSDHITKGAGCPVCRESKGEKIIREFLNNADIIFEEQKRFESCKNKRTLPFDFYLPDYNLCIEFQGKQHYLIDSLYSSNVKFQAQQINDNIKRDWCSKPENPNLLEIPYTEFNNIEKILKEELKL